MWVHNRFALAIPTSTIMNDVFFEFFSFFILSRIDSTSAFHLSISFFFDIRFPSLYDTSIQLYSIWTEEISVLLFPTSCSINKA